MRLLCVTAKIKPFEFHTTRDLTAFTLIGLGDEIGIIQTVLRHKRANTTERYLRSIELEADVPFNPTFPDAA
jgi:integrase